MRIKFIVNPWTKRRPIWNYLKEVTKWSEWLVKKKGVEIDISFTSKFGKETDTELAKKAIEEGFDLMVAVGGDGTVNGVVNGGGGREVPLGIVPTGVGNDFARNLGVPLEIKKALNGLIQPKITRVDLGKVNDRYFVNSASFGLDAKVTQIVKEVKERFQILPTEGVYLLTGLREMMSGPPLSQVKLEGDGINFKGKVFLVAIVNGPTYGEIFKIVPEADLRDGLLDVCWIKKMGKLKSMGIMFLAMWGVHLGFPELVKVDRVSSLRISSPTNLCCQVDGEISPSKKEYQIEVLKKALKVVVPE